MTRRPVKVCSVAPLVVFLLVGAVRSEGEGGETKKDKRAIILYGSHVGEPLILDDWKKANLADLLLGGLSFGERRLADASERPCIGLALFTEAEWSHFKTNGLTPSDIGPEVVSTRIRFFPGRKGLGPLAHRAGAGVLVELHPETGPFLMDEGVIPFDLERVNEGVCDVLVEEGAEPEGFKPWSWEGAVPPLRGFERDSTSRE